MNNKLISVWSKTGHKNGITTHTYLLSILLAEHFPQKNILTMDTNFKFAILEDLFHTKYTKNLDTALNLSTMGGLTKETFCEYIVPVKIKTNNLYNLNASQNNVYNNLREKNKGLCNILNIAREIFHIIIIDNLAGDNDISNYINSKADAVIHFMKQEIHGIQYLKESNDIDEFRNGDKYLNVVNEYSENRGIMLKTVAKNLEINNIEYIPFFEEVIYYMNSNELKEVLKNKDTHYYRQLNSVLNKTLRILGFTDAFVERKEKRNSFTFPLISGWMKKA